MRTRCRRKRGPHAIWCSTVFMTNTRVPIAALHRRARPRQYLGQVGRLLSRTRSHYQRSAKAVGRTRRCHFSLPKLDSKTVPGLMGVVSVKTPIETGESCEIGGASHRPIGLGRDRAPTPLRATVSSGERCGTLPLESIEESRATTTSSVALSRSHGDVAGPGIDSGGGVMARRYQPDWPITNRPPATYRDSTITSQPKPPNKNKSRKTVSPDACRDTRPDAPYHVSNARRHRRPARHRASHRENARPKHLQETRGHQTSRGSGAGSRARASCRMAPR